MITLEWVDIALLTVALILTHATAYVNGQAKAFREAKSMLDEIFDISKDSTP
jgi:hypothetical protein